MMPGDGGKKGPLLIFSQSRTLEVFSPVRQEPRDLANSKGGNRPMRAFLSAVRGAIHVGTS